MHDLDAAILAYRASPQSSADLARALTIQRAVLESMHKR